MTRLKALELVGFKSFADRTRFEFPDGITAIVGPNGSGKSNVVDAIKWVLGEQSVKSLRGREMADVIFAGSAGRKPLNSAETSLVFDNASRMLASEADEVRITRRVYRSGESEYLVNGEIARLRDIREIFSGTGAATEAYSVIEQGRVDALLVASGRDRRLVFEEAAGITRFRTRRAEALRRLERTEQNRQRLADIVGEITARLSSVRQQAARARRHQEVTSRLKALRLRAASVDLAEVDAAAALRADAITGLREEIAIHDAVMTDAERRLAAIDGARTRLDAEIESTQQSFAAADRRRAEGRTTLSLLASRHAELADEIARGEESTRQIAGRLRDSRAAVNAAAAGVEAAEAAVDRIVEALDAGRVSAGTSADDISQARLALERGRLTVREAEAARARSEFEVVRLQEAMKTAEDSVARSRTDLERLRERLAGSSDAIASLEAAATLARIRLSDSERQLESLDASERDAARRAMKLREELADRQVKQEACRERARVLADLADRRDGVSDAAKDFLASGAPGLRGIVAEWIAADPSVAPLVDAALGGLAGWLVVDSSKKLLEWIDAAPRPSNAGGRVGCILLDLLPSEGAVSFEPSVEGVVGRLDRLLGIASDAPPGIERLLGRAWVVESLSVAAIAAASAPAGHVFVTRRGEMVASDGRLEFGTAGSAAGGGSGLVWRRSELTALAATIEEAEGRIEVCRVALHTLDVEQERLSQAIHLARQQATTASEAVASEVREIVRLRAERTAHEASAERAEADFRQALDRLDRLLGDHSNAVVSVDASIRSAADAAAALRSLEAAAAEVDRHRDAAVERVASLRVEEASCRQRLVAVRERLRAAEIDRDTLIAASAECRDRGRASAARIDELDFERLTRTAGLAEAAWEAERLEDRLRGLFDDRESLQEARAAATADAAQARDASASLAVLLRDAELASEDLRHRRDRIVERIRDDYAVDVETERHALAGEEPPFAGDRESLNREIEELRRKLAAMPSVNLEALAEAEELGKRHADMQAQLDDLTEAKHAVESLIARIDEESRQLLAATIETVRGHFRMLFENLFGGGQADIVLDPTVDLLETAVEIVARPPGKEPRSISLLSGGEKTMTCVALLLAVFKSRPSPFCVLDEVDAALDEANVDRFVGVLRDFLSSTQFILVTHSKKTMAAADNLYGVTMEESGVSKRVAVRLERPRAAALTRAA